MPNSTPQRAIGWWLKRADDAITKHVDDAQALHGVSRTEWQLLNTLFEFGTADRHRLLDSLRPFVDRQSLDPILIRFTERAWIAESGDAVSLTDEGHRVHRTVLAAQQDVRRRAMQGISEDEYATAIKVLDLMIRNLER